MNFTPGHALRHAASAGLLGAGNVFPHRHFPQGSGNRGSPSAFRPRPTSRRRRTKSMSKWKSKTGRRRPYRSSPARTSGLPDLTLAFPNRSRQARSPVTHPDAFTLASDQIRITVVSDLPGQEKDGWRWEIPGHSKAKARIRHRPATGRRRAPSVVAPDLAQRMERADQALRQRLQWAGETLPQVSTGDPAFDDLYRRCILSVLESGGSGKTSWPSLSMPWAPGPSRFPGTLPTPRKC